MAEGTVVGTEGVRARNAAETAAAISSSRRGGIEGGRVTAAEYPIEAAVAVLSKLSLKSVMAVAKLSKVCVATVE